MVVMGQTESEASVANTERGVDVTIRPKDPRNVGDLQTEVRLGVMLVNGWRQLLVEMTGRVRPGEDKAEGREGIDFMEQMVSRDVEVRARRVAGGMVVSLSSDNPELVHVLQQNASKWVAEVPEEQARLRRRARENRVPELFEVLGRADVKLGVKETDRGIVAEVTSGDPAVAKEIKEKLPKDFDTQQKIARLALESWTDEIMSPEPGLGIGRLCDVLTGWRSPFRILGRADVKLEVKETDKGVVVEVTSGDPAVAKEIKEKLPKDFDTQQKIARLLLGAETDETMEPEPGLLPGLFP